MPTDNLVMVFLLLAPVASPGKGEKMGATVPGNTIQGVTPE